MPNGTHRQVDILDWAALLFSVVTILMFQSGLYGYTLSSVTGGDAFIQAGYRSFLALGLILMLLTLKQRWRLVVPVLWPVYAVLACIVAVSTFHDLGSATTSLMSASILITTLATLLAGCRYTPLVMRILALAAIGFVVHLLLEMFVPGTLSTTRGRAAGLHQNPNLAGIILALSAGAVVSFVDRRWTGAFVVIASAGLIATISRSAMLVFAVALSLAIPLAVGRDRTLWNWTIGSRQWLTATGTAFVLCSSVFVTSVLDNSAFATAFTGSARMVMDSDSKVTSLTQDITTKDAIEVAKQLGSSDSGAARIVLLRNAYKTFVQNPWSGVGPVRAHEHAPHNQYAYFALSFGLPGLLLGIALVAAFFFVGRSRVLFPLAFAGALMFSHDFSITALSVTIGLGLGGMAWRTGRYAAVEPSKVGQAAASEQLPELNFSR